MKKTSALKQIPVCTAKNFRLFMNQNDWKFIIIAGVISFLVCSIVGEDMFKTYESTKSGFFAIMSACIWIGVFNSIQRICKEHSTITTEYRSGLHISAYVISHIVFDFALCLIQSVILVAVCCAFIDFPKDSVILGNSIIEYTITFFAIIWCSDIMGIMISSVSPDPNTAMMAMPFVLILQLVMSGVLFDLKGIAKKVAYITYSKWGMSALGSIGNLNDKDLPFQLSEVFPDVVRFEEEAVYKSTPENLLKAWGVILLIGAVCAVISIVSLKIKNKGA